MSIGVELERAGDLVLPSSLKALYEAEQLTATSLVVADPQISFDSFEQIARDIADFRLALGRLSDMSKFWAGDLMLAGESIFGEPAYQAFEALDVSPGARQDWLRVARTVLPDQRRKELTWTHHRIVASKTADQQAGMLQTAVDDALSANAFREYVRDLDSQLAAGDGKLRERGDVGDPDQPIVVEQLIETARLIFHQAQRLPDGVLVPFEPWQQFAAALGEE